MRVRSFLTFVATAIVSLTSFAVSQATASPFEIWRNGIWPTPSEKLGVPIWQGAYIKPNFGFDTFELKGAGSAGFDDLEGFTVGGLAGYDWQFGRFVLGVSAEGSLAFADEQGRGPAAGLEAELESFGAFRVRLGTTIDRFMVYGTGGLSVARLTVSNATTSDTELLTGWVAGGGIEYMYWQNVSLRVEYTYSDFGDETFTTLPNREIGLEGSQVQVGFIRRF